MITSKQKFHRGRPKLLSDSQKFWGINFSDAPHLFEVQEEIMVTIFMVRRKLVLIVPAVNIYRLFVSIAYFRLKWWKMSRKMSWLTETFLELRIFFKSCVVLLFAITLGVQTIFRKKLEEFKRWLKIIQKVCESVRSCTIYAEDDVSWT